MTSRLMAGLAVLGVAAGATATLNTAAADPCGMVPPIQMIERDAITRVGLQKTFISYHKGVETMVLRPGFSGKVDEFGMLIPFPSPPALRKVDDNIFPHVAAAVDPPEIVARVIRYNIRAGSVRSKRSMAPSAARPTDDADLSFDTVKVVKREAVGMYDVAVLAAGSSQALSRWMDDHGFRYPEGMDATVQDYVNLRWYFVAIKTKVGKKDGVNPRPGMRGVNSKLPSGATFNGHVQAMGFRFKSDRLVVPMRLSAFNPGQLRNVVYILTDGPRRILDIPKRYVMRQISGKELYNNVTKPLPLRVIGGTYKDLQPWQKQNLKSQRNPVPHNGKAKELFASDLLAVRSGRLANPVEDKEKSLLAIGERLGLRGHQIDQMHDQVLDKERKQAEKKALHLLKKMTLTVVDGDFDRQVIARDNLTFARYRMPKHRNNRIKYDASKFGPGQKMPGKLYRSASMDTIDTLHPVAESDDPLAIPERGTSGIYGTTTGSDGASTGSNSPAGVAAAWTAWSSVGIGAGVLLLCLGMGRRSRRTRGPLPWLALVLGLSVGAAVVGHSAKLAFGVPAINLQQLLADLGDDKKAESAVESLKSFGPAAIDPLVDEIVDSRNVVQIGWAIVAVAEIGGDKADRELRKLHENSSQSRLVRTWAAAARIDMAKTTDEVFALMPLASSFPALQRPLSMQLLALMPSPGESGAAEAMLTLAARAPNLQRQLAQQISQLSPAQLVDAMAHAKDQNARRTAAGYLAGMVGKHGTAIGDAVIDAYRFSAGAKDVPWAGGPLFVPGLSWNKAQARALVGHLVRWHLWADINGQSALQQQIHNNLRSVALVRAGGYSNPGWNAVSTPKLLSIWGQVIGKVAMRKLLAEQGAVKTYGAVLQTLR